MGIRYAKGAITLKASEDAFLFKFLNLNCFLVLDINKRIYTEIILNVVLYNVFELEFKNKSIGDVLLTYIF